MLSLIYAHRMMQLNGRYNFSKYCWSLRRLDVTFMKEVRRKIRRARQSLPSSDTLLIEYSVDSLEIRSPKASNTESSLSTLLCSFELEVSEE